MSDLERLQTTTSFEDDEPPPTMRGQWQHKEHNEPPSGGVIIHTVAEESKSRWSHIEDLDSFFKNIYLYHQKNGFSVMLVQKFSDLLQVAFILFLSVYLVDCVNYDVLFSNKVPDGKAAGAKVTMADVVLPPAECLSTLSFKTWIFILVGFGFWLVKLMATVYQFVQFWDIKSFFNQALSIDDGELDSISWREVQRKLVDAQKDHLMCIHKEQLTDLDIYHRILRFKNYMVAMVNKDILPIRISLLPCLPSFVFLSHGLKFNLEWLFFKVTSCILIDCGELNASCNCRGLGLLLISGI